MKKKLIPIAVFVLFISLFSSNSFAQADPGGSGSGGGTIDPSPVSFKRNNGNGTCGGEAEIRVSFSELPEYLPIIAEIKYEGNPITGVVTGDIDPSQFATKGYVSYCIISANIFPAVKLSIRFHYEESGQDFWITEGINPTGK